MIWGAIADYDEAIRLDPQDADAFYNRGTPGPTRAIWPARSRTMTRRSVSTRRTRSRSSTGVTPGDQGDLDGAIADYDEAIRLDPEDADVFRIGGTPDAPG